MPNAHLNLGVVYVQQGQLELANAEYRKVLERQSDRLPALNSLAWNLATMPNAAPDAAGEAVKLAERAVALTSRRDLSVLQTLAAAYAAAGRFDDAVATAEHVLREARRSITLHSWSRSAGSWHNTARDAGCVPASDAEWSSSIEHGCRLRTSTR